MAGSPSDPHIPNRLHRLLVAVDHQAYLFLGKPSLVQEFQAVPHPLNRSNLRQQSLSLYRVCLKPLKKLLMVRSSKSPQAPHLSSFQPAPEDRRNWHRIPLRV